MGVVGGIGAKLLAKMGWSEGTGLGARRDGPVEPLAVPKRAQNLGVGALPKRQYQDAWWEKAMEDAYGKASGNGGDEELLKACEGRRCRPHGSAKLARLEAQDHGKKVVEVENGASELKKKVKKDKEKRKEKKLKVKKDGLVKEKTRRKKRKRDKVVLKSSAKTGGSKET